MSSIAPPIQLWVNYQRGSDDNPDPGDQAMTHHTAEWTLRRFSAPDEVREFPYGRYEIVQLGGLSIGRARYEPGWKWSTHVGPGLGLDSCPVEHVGLVVSGCVAVRMDSGAEFRLRPGDAFHVAPGHDSWVVGDEPYVSLHFHGVEGYAAQGDDEDS